MSYTSTPGYWSPTFAGDGETVPINNAVTATEQIDRQRKSNWLWLRSAIFGVVIHLAPLIICPFQFKTATYLRANLDNFQKTFCEVKWDEAEKGQVPFSCLTAGPQPQPFHSWTSINNIAFSDNVPVWYLLNEKGDVTFPTLYRPEALVPMYEANGYFLLAAGPSCLLSIVFVILYSRLCPVTWARLVIAPPVAHYTFLVLASSAQLLIAVALLFSTHLAVASGFCSTYQASIANNSYDSSTTEPLQFQQDGVGVCALSSLGALLGFGLYNVGLVGMGLWLLVWSTPRLLTLAEKRLALQAARKQANTVGL